MGTYQDRVVWITGASSGIGAALTRCLLQQGHPVIASARREDRLLAWRSHAPNPERYLPLPLDVTDQASLEAATKRATQWRGRIDTLVNNAGISQRALAENTPVEAVRKIMEVNFFGAVALTLAVLPQMKARNDGQIAVISSVAGYVATPLRSTYAASKHALHGYYEGLRAELDTTGIDITMITPGYVQTEVIANAFRAQNHGAPPPPKGMSADRAAHRMAKALKNRRREVYIGGPEIAAIYLRRLFPSLAARLVPRASPE